MVNRTSEWELRASQNLKTATLLACRSTPLFLPAVSHIYYAGFQASHAFLHRTHKTLPSDATHGNLWEAVNKLRPGLGNDLRDLHSWRRKADYATGLIPDERARELIEQFATVTRSLGIKDSP